jgi:hypothetical protein
MRLWVCTIDAEYGCSIIGKKQSSVWSCRIAQSVWTNNRKELAELLQMNRTWSKTRELEHANPRQRRRLHHVLLLYLPVRQSGCRL